MITKMPYRMAAIAALELGRACNFWDVGFCTGSVSIESRLQFPHLLVTAFEKRLECEGILEVNSRRFGTPGIVKVMGDFLLQDHRHHCVRTLWSMLPLLGAMETGLRKSSI